MTEKQHYSPYYDKLQIEILRAITGFKKQGITLREEQLEQLIDAVSLDRLRETVQGIHDNRQFQLSSR